MTSSADPEVEAFVREWVRAMREQDVDSAARLRSDDYRLVWEGGADLTREQELALLQSRSYRFRAVTLETLSTERTGDEAQAVAEIRVAGDFAGETIDRIYRYKLRCRRSPGGWTAYEARVVDVADRSPHPAAGAAARLRSAAAMPSRLFRRLRRIGASRPERASFQRLAYLPYRPGRDYVLPPFPAPAEPGQKLPVPPQELWLGYDYEAHGETHVRTMLDIVGRSGLTLGPGDRILDLGCGAGRMIRHLRPFADSCEIWGTDISAPHILWCREHLSPPFHFATTTKVPHLPFEDGSFELIYCGSLFTHIDDLADAWLLELRRILAPGRGRLYVTLHDERTIELFELPRYSHAAVVRGMKASPTFAQAKEGFGMFTIGRDDLSQVFYRRDYFAKMASGMFDLLSVTEEAYHYQTAFLMARKAGRAQSPDESR